MNEQFEIKQSVHECLYRYARAVDRCDWEGVSLCFHEDAFFHHGAYHGGVEGLILDMQQRHASIDSSTHYIANILVDVLDEETALSEAYALCYLRRKAEQDDGVQVRSMVRCRYLDKCRPDELGRWRIAKRMTVFDEMVVEEVRDIIVPEASHGIHSAADPLREFLEKGENWHPEQI